MIRGVGPKQAQHNYSVPVWDPHQPGVGECNLCTIVPVCPVMSSDKVAIQESNKTSGVLAYFQYIGCPQQVRGDPDS